MGRAKTRAFIRNLETGNSYFLPFNPSGFSDNHPIIYNSRSAPGSPAPKTQFVSGASKTFDIELFLYDKKGREVKKVIAFLNDFIPIVAYGFFRKPPLMLFSFGWYVKTCVMENLSVTYEQFDNNLNPTLATAKLTLKVVA